MASKREPVPVSGVGSLQAVDSAPVEMPEALVPPRQRRLAKARSDVQAIFDGYGFPVLGTMSHFCAKRIMSTSGDFSTFDVFTSATLPTELVRAYETRLTKRGFSSTGEATRWELPPGAPVAQRSLSISKPSAPGQHQSCKGSLPSGTKSILVLLRNE